MLPKVYKLQSNNPHNKYKAEIHKDDGLLGIEFTLDKTISEFIRTSEKLNLVYDTSFAKFGNVLLGCYQTDWKQVLSGIEAALQKFGHTMYDQATINLALMAQSRINPGDATSCTSFRDFVVHIQQFRVYLAML